MERSTTTPLDDNDIMWFGAHKGKPLHRVPASYLLWLYDKDDGLWCDNTNKPMDMLLKVYIEDNYDNLRMDHKDFEPCHPYRKSR